MSEVPVRFRRFVSVPGLLAGLALLVWVASVAWPAVALAGWLRPSMLPAPWDFRLVPASRLLGGTLLLAALIATAAVALGWTTGRLLASSRRGRLWRPAMIVPLMVPPEVWGYGWSLLIDPAGLVGTWLSGRGFLAAWLPRAGVAFLMAAWFWPLAAWLLAYGFSRLDRRLLDQARLETASRLRLLALELRLMGGSLATAWLVVWGLALGSFTALQLSGVKTFATELNLLWDLTGRPGPVAWAGLPLVILAAGIAAVVDRRLLRGGTAEAAESGASAGRGAAWVSGGLWLLLVAAPVGLMLGWVHSPLVWQEMLTLSGDAVAGSLEVGVLSALLALVLGLGGAVLERTTGRLPRAAAQMMSGTMLAAGILPGALVAAAAVAAYHRAALDWVYESVGIVVLCHTARFGFVAVFFARWLSAGYPQELADLVRLDGAGRWQTLCHVWWPTYRNAALAIVLVTVMLSAGEVSATVVVLPPGQANLAELMYNQMHYARQEQVVVLSLVWIALAAGTALLIAMASRRVSH